MEESLTMAIASVIFFFWLQPYQDTYIKITSWLLLLLYKGCNEHCTKAVVNIVPMLLLTCKLHAPFSMIFSMHRLSPICGRKSGILGQQKFGAQSASDEHL